MSKWAIRSKNFNKKNLKSYFIVCFNRVFFSQNTSYLLRKPMSEFPGLLTLILTTFKGTVSQEKYCFKKVLLSSGRHQLACVSGPIGMRVGPVGMHARANWHACQGQLACALGPFGMCAWTNWHACRGQLACGRGQLACVLGPNSVIQQTRLD